MEKCNEILDSECSVAHDLKRDISLGPSSLNCVSEIVKEHDQPFEDKNRNITILPSKGTLGAEDKHLSSTTSKDKTNVVGVHVGPNGLINGIEIEPCESLSHLLDHIPSSIVRKNTCTDNTDSSSHNNIKGPSECQPEALLISHGVEHNHNKPESPGVAVISKNFKTNDPVDSIEKSNLGDASESEQSEIEYVSYESELQMPDIMRLIQKDLSEPYSIYTYRYFIHNWPKLCFLAMDGTKCVGAIVCKLDIHRKVVKRGYIAMLAVDEKYRKRKIGSNLVLKAIRAMVADSADEVVLETEITNRPALRLYENLGFVRDKRLFRYYLNGVDALRLKLWLR